MIAYHIVWKDICLLFAVSFFEIGGDKHKNITCLGNGDGQVIELFDLHEVEYGGIVNTA